MRKTFLTTPRTLMITMAGAALIAAFFAQVGLAQSTAPKQQAVPKPTAQAPAKAPASIPAGDWPMYSRDLTSSRYSPLKQIATTNVSKMEKVWSYRPAAPAPAPGQAGAAPAPDTTKDGGAKGERAEAEVQQRPPSWLSRRPSW